MALSSEPIEWEEHEEWFKKKLRNPDSCIYIAFNDKDEAIGQIRFELVNDYNAEVDVHTKPGLRNRGFGTEIISMGVSRYLDRSPVTGIIAIIKTENVKSKRAFAKSGFREIGKKLVKGYECYQMVKYRS
jgi:RimJ/RimL family protein N-acetyltransferase